MPAHRSALEAEVRFLVDEVERRTAGTVRLSPEEMALSDPTRSEAAAFIERDGAPLRAHPRAATWKRGRDNVVLPDAIAHALGLPSATTIADVIKAVKTSRWSPQ
jgi:hypothetical protein